MPATEPDYDVMQDLTDEAATEDGADEDESGSALDAELLMHAEAAGLDPKKAEALKDFVDRCMSLKDEGAYEADDTGADDTDTEE